MELQSINENTFCSSSPHKSSIVIETVSYQAPSQVEINSDWKTRTPGPKLSPACITSVIPEVRQSLASLTDNVQAVKHHGYKFILHATNGFSKVPNSTTTLARLQLFNENQSLDKSTWETYFGKK